MLLSLILDSCVHIILDEYHPRVKSIQGTLVLALPYQINSLPGQVTNV